MVLLCTQILKIRLHLRIAKLIQNIAFKNKEKNYSNYSKEF